MRRRVPVARLVFFAHLLLVNFTQASQSIDHSQNLLNENGQIQIGYRSFLEMETDNLILGVIF